MVRNNASFDLMIMVSVIGIITGKVQIEGNNVWYRWRGLPSFFLNETEIITGIIHNRSQAELCMIPYSDVLAM